MEEAKKTIQKLIEKYEKLTKEEINRYKEEGTKKDFILPLFRALGWNVDSGYEVPAEEDASGGRVDYAFRIDGVTKFYLEAKNLKENLDDPKFSQQALNYAYHKGIPWVVLTDFEGIKVFNAEWDYKTDYRRNQYFELKYNEFLTKFEHLELLSRSSFEKGLLDSDALEHGAKPKKTPVDQVIASDLVRWREELTKQVQLWNDKKILTEKSIDESVQRLLDRFIFIRTTEDRGIEDNVLKSAVMQWELNGRKQEMLVKKLREEFRRFDDTYNSELFKIHTLDILNFEENDLAKIIKELYESQQGITYDFQAINADVLGRIYEQYLGFIQKKENIEESGKNSKRKKQGIYYTPTYIVEYIVQNTLGKLLKEKSLREIKELKILDPACGSGSFLIKAFQVMDEYIKVQENQGVDANKDFMRKVQILLNNIYGVDLDYEASEIARLNLLLRTLTYRTKLPELSKNIKTGNSLISGSDEELEKYFGKDFKSKKPFDWQEKYPEVFKKDGFDVIIGNPPYLSIERGLVEDLAYFRSSYSTIEKIYDIFGLFIEKALHLLRSDCYLGFIVPNIVLGNDSFRLLRKKLISETTILSISNYKDDVFKDAVVPTAVLIIQKKSPDTRHEVIIRTFNNGVLAEGKIKQSEFNDSMYRFNLDVDDKFKDLKVKIYTNTKLLKDVLKIQEAMKTGNDKEFISDKPIFHENQRVLLKGSDINRFEILNTRYVNYDKNLLKRPGKKEVFELPEKLYIRRVANAIISVLDNKQRYAVHTLYTGVVLDKEYSYKYLLALLNSKLFTYLYKMLFPFKGSVFPEIRIGSLGELPVKIVSAEKQKKFADMVDKIVDCKSKFNSAPDKSEEWEELKTENEKLDKKIDDEVYKFYGLTEEEIKIIEKS